MGRAFAAGALLWSRSTAPTDTDSAGNGKSPGDRGRVRYERPTVSRLRCQSVLRYHGPPFLREEVSSGDETGDIRANCKWLYPMKTALNRTAVDLYTAVTTCAAVTRRSSVGLKAQSLINQAPRGLEPPL